MEVRKPFCLIPTFPRIYQSQEKKKPFMKNRYWSFIWSFFLFGCSGSPEVTPVQKLYRHIEDRKEILVPARDRIWIRTGAPADYFIKKYPEIKAFAYSETEVKGVYIHPPKDIFDFINRLSRDPEVIYVSPFLLTENGQEFGGLTNQILVYMKEGKSLTDLKKAFGKYEVKEYKENLFNPSKYIVTLKEKNAIKSLAVANELHETASFFVYVEVNYLLIFKLGDIGEKDPAHGERISVNI